jgi:hypothetical protein
MPAFTISDAARHCGVDRRTLQRAIRRGRLALTPDHHLTPEALAQAGYGHAAASQGRAAGAPQGEATGMPQGQMSQITPQYMPQEMAQATALLALLERLTTAITDLHQEVRSLREDLRQASQETPQRRHRGATPMPQETPQEAPQDLRHATAAPQVNAAVTPQETPQQPYDTAAAPQEDTAGSSQSLRHATAAPQSGPATAPRPATLPVHIHRIAETAMQYDKLSLADLSQLLFDRQIYRAKDRQTGAAKPVNRGTLQKWLEQARRAGVL